jgi:signal transduction histidine kinase
MKTLSMRYQIFLSMMLLIALLFFTIYLGMNELVPKLYETQIQKELQQEIIELEEQVLSTASSLNLNLASFIEASSYKIDIYTLDGQGVFHSTSQVLRIQTLILLQNGVIESRFFDSGRLFYTRIVTLDTYIVQLSADVASFYTMLDVVNTLTFVLGMSTIVLGIVISFILSKRMSQPIKNLTQQVLSNESIIPMKRYDEIGVLSQTLYQYQSRLEHIIEELKRELAKEKHQDVLMKTFIANISHELQTPLSVMLIATETLEDKVISKDVKQSYTDMIKSEIFHLKHMTQDLLMIASKQTGVLELHKATHDVNQLFIEVIAEMKLIHPEAIITMNANKKVMMYSFDRVKMKQVLYNIIKNGLIHQMNTKNMTIELTSLKKELHISLCNPNSHIDDEDLPHIFDSFYKKDSKGSGLGLSIVKSVLEAHHVAYHIKNKDQGVCFHMTWKE